MAPNETTLTVFVDSAQPLEQFLQELITRVENPYLTTLYIDLEGVNLSRDGTVSIVTLLINDNGPDPDRVYLIDIHTLGSSAFTTPVGHSAPGTGQPKTLKYILESPITRKVFFDVRNDSDALFSHYGIKMQGVIDLQLMENASRPGNARQRKFLNGLAKCIKEHSRLSKKQKKKWEKTKEEGRRLFDPNRGGRYEVFNERPLSEEIHNYCQQDVQFMPGLYDIYSTRLRTSFAPNGNWYSRIGSETEKRLKDSMSENYEPHGRNKTLAPVWETIRTMDEEYDNEFQHWGEWEEEDDDEVVWENDTARDCIGWEDDMVRQGEFFF